MQRSTRRWWMWLLCAVLVGNVVAGCAIDDDVATDEEAIVSGWLDPDHQAVGALFQSTPGLAGFTCSGTLVAPRLFLTAAHCVDRSDYVAFDNDVKTLSVRFGDPASGGFALRDVVAGRVAPGWIGASNGFANDVALLELATAAPVEPLPLNTLPPLIGDYVTLVGYGITNPGVVPDVQRRAGTGVVRNVDALTLTIASTPSSTCSGDSGGPTLTERSGQAYVAAVHSLGDCATVAIDTRVDAFASFLSPLISSGVEGLWCGNGLCEAGETGGWCPVDCCDGQTACSVSHRSRGVAFCTKSSWDLAPRWLDAKQRCNALNVCSRDWQCGGRVEYCTPRGAQSTPCSGQRFADAPPDSPYFHYVNTFGELGITAGCGGGNFCGSSSVTRGQLAVFLIRAKNLVQGSWWNWQGLWGSTPDNFSSPTQPAFADVPATHPFFRHIQKLRDLGYTAGCGVDAQGRLLFCPDRAVTQEEAAVLIVRTSEGDAFPEPPSVVDNRFDDVPATRWSNRYVDRALERGIDCGCAVGQFCPTASLARGEAAASILRAFYGGAVCAGPGT